MQLTIGALKQAAAWPGTGQRTLVVLPEPDRDAGPCQEGLKYLAAHLAAECGHVSAPNGRPVPPSA
jgi:hypothetical protein